MERGYQIVPGRPEHLPQIAEIERAAGTLFPEADIPAAMLAQTTPIPQLREAQEAGRLWVALSASGEPVGFAFARDLEGEAHLQEVDVRPDHGRRGIGASLVQAVAGWARASGTRRLTLTTFVHLAWNAPFYEGLGFRRIPAAELTPALSAILRREAEEGLDPSRRVAMGLDLGVD